MTMYDPLTGREREESGGGGQPAVPVALREVSKLYRHGQNAVRALDGVSAEFARHSFTAVMGPPGRARARCCIAPPAWSARPRERSGWPDRTLPGCPRRG